MYDLGIVHAVFLCMDSAPCAFFVPVASEFRRKSMESILIYVLFAVGIVLIVKGGDWFVDGAVWAAEITRIPKFIIGATIISVATTLPEIFVSTIAAVEGHGILVSQVGDYIAASQDKVGMAIGNGIGSVICNTAMILAISIIFMPIAVDKRSFAPKGILLIAAVCALFLLSRSGSLSIAGAAVLLFIFLLYITENIRSAKREAGAEETEEAPASDRKSIVLNILRIVGGAACIVVGSQLLVSNGSLIAASWGVSEAIIGVTIVAIGTSLPELVTSIVATKKGDSGLALGNAIGSNLFNILFILGMSAVISPLHVLGESVIDTVLLLGSAILLFVFARTGRRMTRSEGAACVLLYVAYTAYLFVR